MYGDGPLRQPLVELRDALGLAASVDFAGGAAAKRSSPRSTGPTFSAHATVTSDGDRDGIPNVLVEAMACGLPVVSTAAGAIPELVTNGDNGFLVDPGDVASVESQIATLLDSPPARHRMGIAARRTVESGYDVQRCRGATSANLLVGADRGSRLVTRDIERSQQLWTPTRWDSTVRGLSTGHRSCHVLDAIRPGHPSERAVPVRRRPRPR